MTGMSVAVAKPPWAGHQQQPARTSPDRQRMIHLSEGEKLQYRYKPSGLSVSVAPPPRTTGDVISRLALTRFEHARDRQRERERERAAAPVEVLRQPEV